MTERKPSLGFIGLGLMGRPMTLRLLEAGYEVHVWNRDPQKMAALVEAGAKGCAGPAEVAAAAEMIMLCLTDGRAVRQVALGPGGLLDGARPGSLVIDFSSISSELTRDIARETAEKGRLDWIDAPVSGGVAGAEKGTLAIMCGGKQEAIDRAGAVFAPLSRKVTRMGDVGAGQVAKLCNQLIVSTNVIAIAEAIHLGRRAGIEVEKLPEAFAGGFADSLPLQIFGSRMASGIHSPVLGRLAIMRKDVESVMALVGEVGLDAPMIATALGRYLRAEQLGLAEEDLSRVADCYEDNKGSE